MILLIDIFSRAYMSYGKVLLVAASCTQSYDDSNEIATIMEGEVCTSGTHNRFTWSGLIIILVISASTCYFGVIASTRVGYKCTSWADL